MSKISAFFAYSSGVPEITETIRTSISEIARRCPHRQVQGWETNDVVGRCLVDPILEAISEQDCLIADISSANFNVTYEIGFAIGRGKRIHLVKNRGFKRDEQLFRKIGIFDTIGYQEYSTVNEIVDFVKKLDSKNPLPLKGETVNQLAPVYVVVPRIKTESEIRIISRFKKTARVPFRQFDPQESGRLSVSEAITEVCSSVGVVLPLISENRADYNEHNLRCAFIAGLAHALDCETLLLQSGSDPVPLDFRDAVSTFQSLDQINQLIASFVPKVNEKVYASFQLERQQEESSLESLHLGASAAENEIGNLSAYFVETDEFNRVVSSNIQLVAGRKGSGKSALFFQVRNRVRRDKSNIVLDLHPEGYQLKKLKDFVLKNLETGTQEHTISAFWEYVFLLEIAYKILEKDAQKYRYDHNLRELYEDLEENYRSANIVSKGDFAERMMEITKHLEDTYLNTFGSESDSVLTREQITEILYSHDIRRLKSSILEYLSHKGDVWILFDNIDKGWAFGGVDNVDLINVRCLVESLNKLRNDLRRDGISFNGVVFLRNDVYELLVQSTSDRGKLSKVVLDWTDPEMLREMLRRRFVLNRADQGATFDELWRSIAQTHLSTGEETSAYLISRCLMRPRSLIDLLRHCKSHAVNLGNVRIEENDFIEGEKAFSTDLINQIDLEIQDVYPDASDVLYSFIEGSSLLSAEELQKCIESLGVKDKMIEEIERLLLWYSFIGILREDGEATFIYDVHYEMRKLQALIKKRSSSELVYCINPAFWRGLDISE